MTIMAVSRAEDALLRGVVQAQTGAQYSMRRFGDRAQTVAESHPAWFAIVIPLVVLAGIAIFAYLTVQCWNRGYSGFTGRFTMEKGWTSATIRFECA